MGKIEKHELKKGYALTSAGQVHYRCIGEGDPIVLLPPSGRSCMVYGDLMRALSEQHFVIGLDPPGCGQSVAPPAGATIEAMGGWLAEAIGNLDLRNVNLFGLHSGNKLATALAANSSGIVRKLVLAGLSHSLIPDPVLRRKLFLKYVPSLTTAPGTPDQSKALREWMAKYAEINALWLDTSVLNEPLSTEASMHRLETIVDYMQALAWKSDLLKATLAYPFEKDLARLTMPTLILEIVTPEEERLLGHQGPMMRTIIEDFHWVALSEPDMKRPTFTHRAFDIRDAMTEFLR